MEANYWKFLLLYLEIVFLLNNVGQTSAEFGKRQSPINLVTAEARHKNLKPLVFGRGFYKKPTSQQISTNRDTLNIISNADEIPTLSGGPLAECYQLDHIHFHWGPDDSKGSEHTINSRYYPMEMHMVLTKKNLTFQEALGDPTGITVVGYFINIQKTEDSKAISPFTVLETTMPKLRVTGEPVDVTRKFAISNLAIPFSYNYLTYQGSLTTPNYNEVVTWIISPMILKIREETLDSFRTLYNRNLIAEPKNYREIQARNGRTVILAERSSYRSLQKPNT